ncbi:hypothetical protein BET09_07095 [Pediococcus acidilactici]|nr:hypothetical protein BET09_07095 [Pediococcus acidilactici]
MISFQNNCNRLKSTQIMDDCIRFAMFARKNFLLTSHKVSITISLFKIWVLFYDQKVVVQKISV